MTTHGIDVEHGDPARRAGSAQRSTRPRTPQERRDRVRRRAIPAAIIAAVAFAVGVAIGAGGDDGEQAVTAYAKSWSAGDWAGMHAQLTADAQRRTGLIPFADANRAALKTATATEGSVTAGTPEKQGDNLWRVPVQVRTRIFGTVKGDVLVPVAQDGDAVKIAWAPHLVFPELKEGQQLTRQTQMRARGSIFARDGTALASGPERTSSIADVAQQVAGKLDVIPEEERGRLEALGVPADARVGTSGLERIFDARLAGLPSGRLLAGGRVIARSPGRRGASVRTTIDPRIERAASSSLAGRYGGAVAFDPRTGAVLAFSGVPFSLLQPPGSTFKVVTTSGALDNGTTKMSDTYPFEGRAILSGVPLANAGGEVCGGSLPQAFAESCNSVFAPMGVKLGPAKLVATAEKFGFNQPGQFAGVAESTIPQADAIGDDLAVGSTAIGQGEVQATTLQMAETAGVIANNGRRVKLTLDLAEERRAKAGTGERVVSAKTARQMRELMLGVVRSGTGTAAAIAGVPVAGKTGTAELRSREPGDTSSNPADTTAWFVAYAPAAKDRKPRIAVGVMLPGQGAGGESAAPAAREILAAGLLRD